MGEFELSGLTQATEAEIYHYTGQLAARFNISPGQKIHLPELPSGYYFLKLFSAGKSTQFPFINQN